ncbi:DUF6095 family protein [Psychroflexus maritimus]|uniref:Uncharacterized protein n=1 Tax=Psychroflexus maritimus TaxID=2714865 RepID=A0A967E3G4_9FLAO|nr:DUF6095 family protein [Psychroflexus maritimus]NGZ90679.1 hypothetical protein [Psychroflexus maritimus]
MGRKHTNKEKLMKGVRILAGSLPLIFIAPAILFSAFNNQDKPLFVPVLIVALILIFFTIWLIFLGIKNVVSGFFDD